MNRSTLIANTLFAGFAILTLTTTLKATAAPVTVTRGPHGAAFIIDSKTPVTQAKTTMPSTEQMSQEVGSTHTMKTTMRAYAVPSLVKREPHGAGFILNN